MGKFARIQSVLGGIGLILLSIIMMMFPEEGYLFVVFILTLMILARSIKLLALYFTSARYMVGGLSILFRGILYLDFSLFFSTIQDVPVQYVVLYLVIFNLFMGLVAILRANESRRMGASSWKLNLAEGIANILIAFGSAIMRDSVQMVVIFFCIGLILSGIVRIATAFKRTAILFVQ